MTEDGYNAKRTPGTGSGEPGPGKGTGGGRRMSFDCCGMNMEDAMAGRSCGSIMRRHPIVMSAILAIMGLAAVVIPAGAVLGIIAFFRTI